MPRMPTTQQLINELEAAARDAGVPIAKVCKRLKVNRATWQRWKAGHYHPRLGAYQLIVKIHQEMVNGQ